MGRQGSFASVSRKPDTSRQATVWMLRFGKNEKMRIDRSRDRGEKEIAEKGSSFVMFIVAIDGITGIMRPHYDAT